MSWKKNLLSYLLWTIYFAGASIVFWLLGCLIIEGWGQTGFPVVIISGVACVASVGITFILLRFLSGKLKFKKAVPWSVLEGIMIALLLIAGLLLRMEQLQHLSEDATYYEMAKSVEGFGTPLVSHTITKLYIQLLHCLFMVFGNKWIVGIWLQIALQFLAAGLFYIAVREIAGALASVVVVAFLMLAPISVSSGLTYSPEILYFVVYALGLLLLGRYLRRQSYRMWRSAANVLLLLLTGAIVAGACYLDISGISLLLFFLSIINLQWQDDDTHIGKLLLHIFVTIVVILGFFAGYLEISAYFSGSDIITSFREWMSLYSSKGYILSFEGLVGDLLLYTLLSGFMVLGTLGYWCREKVEKITPWILVLVSLCVLEFLQMTTQDINAQQLILCVAAILSGIGVESCCVRKSVGYQLKKKKKEESESEKKEEEKEEEPAKEEESAGEKSVEEVLPEPVEEGAAEEESAGEESAEEMQPESETEGTAEEGSAGEESVEEVQPEPEEEGTVEEDFAEEESAEEMRPESETEGTAEEESAGEESAEEESVEEVSAEEVQPESEEEKADPEVYEDIGEEEEIQLIPNPLPLPKKREKQGMDYPLQLTEEEMKYDIEVDENDDYDI